MGIGSEYLTVHGACPAHAFAAVAIMVRTDAATCYDLMYRRMTSELHTSRQKVKLVGRQYLYAGVAKGEPLSATS